MMKQLSYVMFVPSRRRVVILCLCGLLAGCAVSVPQAPRDAIEAPPRVRYAIEPLPDQAAFRVTVEVDSLTPANRVFSFLRSGPLARIDFGRAVAGFQAFDGAGGSLPTRRLNPYQWLLEGPEQVRRIAYTIRETWRGGPPDAAVWEMLGSTADRRLAYLSMPAVLGYLSNLEGVPVAVEVRRPEGWYLGSVLPSDSAGVLRAANLAGLASAPLLLGDLTYAEDRFHGVDVRVYLYSRTGKVVAADLLPEIAALLGGMNDFIGDLPVRDYTFLVVCAGRSAGGVAYRDNAAFVFRDGAWPEIRDGVRDVLAHELFHLVIPYAIRSDAVALDDLFGNRPTAHLWFFEGVTEWASLMIQVRSGQKSIEEFFFRDLREKLFQEDYHRSGVSLEAISLNRGRIGADDYLSIYSRGALVATLLDIHLLDVTYGKRGLQEVLRDLYLDFGPERPLPEDRFFDILIDYCGPEAEPFIRRYITGTEELPLRDVLDAMGIRYRESAPTGEPQGDLGVDLAGGRAGVTIVWVDPVLDSLGVDLRRGDRVLALDGRPLRPGDLAALDREVARWSEGRGYAMTVDREGRRVTTEGEVIRRRHRHWFTAPERLTPRQATVRRAWEGERTPE